MRVDNLEDGGWGGWSGEEDGAAADAEGEVQRVAEAVGEKQLGDAEATVLLGHVEDAASVEVGSDEHVVVQVNAALGEAGAAAGVEPERGVVFGGWLRFELGA